MKLISANQMIAEFLKAELHSSRFRVGSLKALEMCGYTDDLLEYPDCNDPVENKKRAKVLYLCRGWPNKELFTNFPSDTKWFECKIPLLELKKAYRLKSDPDMTDTQRLLRLTANRVMSDEVVKNIDNHLIGEIREEIEQGHSLPPIILVARKPGDKKVLIEGHSRGVAYSCFEHLDFDIPAIIGLSDNMNKWAYF